MFNKTKIFMNETKAPKGSFERSVVDFVEDLESPLAGTNIGKQFGLKKEEPHEPVKHSNTTARRRQRNLQTTMSHRRPR